MKKAILYIHGKGGSPKEAEQYRKNAPGFEMIGVDYPGAFPWTAQGPIREAYEKACREYDQVLLLASSIGAYFAMQALGGCGVEKALFISPVLDMEQLILDLMEKAGVGEEELRQKGEIPTPFGETLSWPYLTFVREHLLRWSAPTWVLYAGKDALVPRKTVDRFMAGRQVHLTVMEDGEHWFHTAGQLAFLDRWMENALG